MTPPATQEFSPKILGGPGRQALALALAPTLHTQRLTLRLPVLADFPAFAAMMASPRAAFMGGPCGQSAGWGMFCHDIASWTMFGHGGLMINVTATSTTIGQVSLNAGPLFPETELGWMLYDGHEGQGYATEAATALRDWAFAHLTVPSLVSYIDEANAASIAVARRLGATLDATAARLDPEDLVWRHARSRT